VPSRRPRLVAELAHGCRELVVAIGFLTRLPIGRDADPGERARSVVFFPIVGIALGFAAARVAGMAAALVATERPDVAAMLAVLALTMIGNGAFQSAPASVVAALHHARGDRPRALGALRAGAVDSAGRIAVIVLLAAKMVALQAVAVSSRELVLMLAVLLGRWALVVQAYGSIPAEPEGLASSPIGKLEFNRFAVASVFAMGLTLALADAAGLVLLLIVGAQAIVLRILVHRWLGGVTVETGIAGAEVAETTVLCTCAGFSLWLAGS
jgi:cobalamin synthase